MAREQSQRVAEVEDSVVRLHRREMRLRSILKSALTSVESRRDASDELESLLNEIKLVEDELQTQVRQEREKTGHS